jgi:hypothetical protein
MVGENNSNIFENAKQTDWSAKKKKSLTIKKCCLYHGFIDIEMIHSG